MGPGLCRDHIYHVSHIALAAVLLGFGLVEDAAGVVEGGFGGCSPAGLTIKPAEFDLGIGDPRRLSAGSPLEDAEHRLERAPRRVTAMQRVVSEAEIVQIVGNKRMGGAEPALIDRGG